MPWGAQGVSRHAPSRGTSLGICGLGCDGPVCKWVLAILAWMGLFFFFFSLPGASNCCQKALGTFKVLTEKTAVVIFSALLTTNWPVLRLSWF